MNRIDDLLAEGRDDRRRRREAPAVDREAAQRVVADPDDVLGGAVELVVALRRVLRLDDERAEQPAPHLVGRVVVRVVHVRAGRPGRELVRERVAGVDRVLGDQGNAVHVVRQPLAVEMDAGRLLQVVLEDRPDLVALDDVEPRPGPHRVEPERRDRVLHRVDLVLDLVDRELEDLDVTVERRLLGLVAGALDLVVLAVEEPRDDR